MHYSISLYQTFGKHMLWNKTVMYILEHDIHAHMKAQTYKFNYEFNK